MIDFLSFLITSWVFWVVVALMVIVAIGGKIADKSANQRLEEKINAVPNFSVTQEFVGRELSGREYGILVDENRRKIALVEGSIDDIEIRVIGYRDLISSEVFVDGDTVARTKRSSQIGGALIGGLAFGGVGAVIGGLSGKTVSSDEVGEVGLRIIINDTARPLYVIYFMRGKRESKASMSYQRAIGQANHWHALVAAIIKSEDSKDDCQVKEGVSSLSRMSGDFYLADELSKLSELRDKGVLTEDEFMAQKQKLLE
jgi:hypothetical protein